ncbi:MAG: STAS domain-containing protein [Candidatus Berkiella sp.]
MQPHEQVMYYSQSNLFILKLKGALRFACAPYIDEAIKHIDINQNEDVIFDLTEAKFIDSTIMGSMAKLFIQESTQKQLKHKPIIVYKNKDTKLIFDKIGFDKFFSFANEDPRLSLNAKDLIGFKEIKTDSNKLKESIKNAHQLLSELHPEDPSYKEVVQAMKDK